MQPIPDFFYPQYKKHFSRGYSAWAVRPGGADSQL